MFLHVIIRLYPSRPPSLPPSFQIQHFEHAFLKESWATYIECCWLEDTEGQDAFLFQVRGRGGREGGREGGA